MTRVAFFGNGSVNVAATVRDGTVADRIELFAALGALGCEVRYLAPPERSPGDSRVVGYTWRGGVDLLVVESRDAAFAPVVVSHREVHGVPTATDEYMGRGRTRRDHCPGLEGEVSYARFCSECTLRSLRDTGAIPVFPQAEVLRDWTLGLFDRETHRGVSLANASLCSECVVEAGACARRPPLLIWDFDMNVRRMLGVSGRGSYYEMGKVWRQHAPWMSAAPEEGRLGVLREIRSGKAGKVVILCPYEPQDTPLLRKVGAESKSDREAGWSPGDDGWEVSGFFDWCYPAWIEEWADDFERGTRDLVYTGSDYNRRRRWAEFYGNAALAGASVAVTGVWGDRRQSREKPPWSNTGWRSEVERRWPGVEFLSGGAGNRQLPLTEALRALAGARAAVQVVPDEYSSCGYYTNRIAESVALGVPIFIDSEIRHHGLERLGFGSLGDDWGWYRVRDWNDLERKLAHLPWDGDRRAKMNAVQRAGLKETHGAARVARRLLDVAGVKG